VERARLGSQPDPVPLKRWLQRWTNVRHREAAERTLLTAIAAVAGIYQRAKYSDEMRTALQRLADHLDQITA